MFIIGKDYKDADGALQVMIGKENFSLINEYFNNYLAVCYNDETLKFENNKVAAAEKQLLLLSCGSFRIFPFMDLARLNSIGNDLDSAKDRANEARKKLQLSLYKLEMNNNDIKNSNVFDRLEKTHGLHAWCKFMNPYVVETTEDDLLLDVVLNNELDLIKDVLNDYRALDFDVRLAKKKGRSNINHKFSDLDLRLQNINLQNEVLKKYQESNQDATLINAVITESYRFLTKGLNDGVTEEEINDYKKKMNFDIEKDTELDAAVKKYVNVTAEALEVKKPKNKKKVK